MVFGGHLLVYATSTATSSRHVKDVADCTVVRLMRLAIPDQSAACRKGLRDP